MQDIMPPERLKQKAKKIGASSLKQAPSTKPAALPSPEAVIEIDAAGHANEVDSEEKRRLLRRPRPSQWSFDWWRAWSRRRKIIVSAVVLVLLLGGIVAATSSLFWRSSEPGFSFTHHKKAVKVITVASPLTGVQVDPSLAARPVTGIMIENSDEARPQSGLQEAGVVYEAIAEGGVTRFLALFQDAGPQYIGPVRSLRPYYIDFAAPFQASIVHVGGSPDALAEVSNGSFRNLDEFANGGYFTRISSRYAPHNVYTSFASLDGLNKAKGYTSSKFISWPRKKDKKLVTPTAKTIQLAISAPDFYANYAYDPASNSYLRSEGGAPHMDLVSSSDATGVQLKPKVVIGLVMNLGRGELDASGAFYSNYQDTGSGTAYIFQDGGVTKGTWTKAAYNSQFSFSDANGAPVKLNAGQTWITVLSAESQITYSP